jgi:hypothetical protein
MPGVVLDPGEYDAMILCTHLGKKTVNRCRPLCQMHRYLSACRKLKWDTETKKDSGTVTGLRWSVKTIQAFPLQSIEEYIDHGYLEMNHLGRTGYVRHG